MVDLVLQDYAKAIDDLTINKPIKDVSEQTQVLATQIESKEAEIQTLREHMTQSERLAQDMKEQLEQSKREMQEQIQSLREMTEANKKDATS